jgi:hypothetical protein
MMREDVLQFSIQGVSLTRTAAVPTLNFLVGIEMGPETMKIHAMLLRVQVQIVPKSRHYSDFVHNRLLDVYGTPERCGETVHSFMWTQASLSVPSFENQTTVDLPIVSTYAFDVLAAKYLQALDDGDIPLEFLFSGTVFYQDPVRGVQVQPISWNSEADFSLPVNIWRELMEAFFPQQGWVRLDSSIIDRLNLFRSRHEVSTWDETVTLLLNEAEEHNP